MREGENYTENGSGSTYALLAVTGGSATELSATGAWAMPLPVMGLPCALIEEIANHLIRPALLPLFADLGEFSCQSQNLVFGRLLFVCGPTACPEDVRFLRSRGQCRSHGQLLAS